MSYLKRTPEHIGEKVDRMRRVFEGRIAEGRLRPQQVSAAFHAFANRWEKIGYALYEEVRPDVVMEHEAIKVMRAANAAKCLASYYDNMLREQVIGAPFYKGLRVVAPR